MPRLFRSLHKKPGEVAQVLLVFSLLLVVFRGIYSVYFPTISGTVGHDFGLALASYIDGFIWFKKNGFFAVPWFSPSICGGVPFFADPQSGYYSVTQWLTFLVDPLTASWWTLLLFASIGWFGSYLLARRSFQLSVSWALLAAALYFFNGFLPHRMLLGETGYHGLTLAPWMALAFLEPAKTRVAGLGFAIVPGLIAAYWLQSGLSTLIVPAALSVGLVLLVYRLRCTWPADIFMRIPIAIGLSIALSLSKLVASLSFYSRFERTQYLLPGFEDIWMLLKANAQALFGSSQEAFATGLQFMTNVQWTVLPHEWAYGFTIAPFLVLLAALVARFLPLQFRVETAGPEEMPGKPNLLISIALWLVMVVILLLPLLIQFYTPGLNAFYKELPLIGATACPMRWLIIYLLALPIATAILASRLLGSRQHLAPWLVGGGTVLIILLNMAEDHRYYYNQPYHPQTILAGYEHLAAAPIENHRVNYIGVMTDAATGREVVDESRNDLIVEGVSQAFCYNPSFGYRLEKFPKGRLAIGDVMAETDGYLNIKNPACYVFPEENQCAPGDHFRSDQRDEAEAFVTYHPFQFDISTAQRIANAITFLGLIAVMVFLSVIWPLSVLWRMRNKMIASGSE